jgi:hypothetical protein
MGLPLQRWRGQAAQDRRHMRRRANWMWASPTVAGKAGTGWRRAWKACPAWEPLGYIVSLLNNITEFVSHGSTYLSLAGCCCFNFRDPPQRPHCLCFTVVGLAERSQGQVMRYRTSFLAVPRLMISKTKIFWGRLWIRGQAPTPDVHD